MNKEHLNIILVDNDEGNLVIFKNVFKDLKINIRVQAFHNGADLMEYLNSEDGLNPEVVFMNFDIPVKSSVECLEEIREDYRFGNLITAIYSDYLPENDVEEVFVRGANIYIKKPDDYDALKKVVSEVITTSWQYHTSGMHKGNFIMKI